MKNKILVFDLDNTLLHSNNTLTDYTLSVLNECQNRGIKTAFATARSTTAASRIMKIFKPDAFIGFSGGLTLCGENEVCRFEISAGDSDKLFQKLINEHDVVHIQATNGITAVSNKIIPTDNWYWSKYVYNDFSQPLNEPFFKITVNCKSPEAIDKIMNEHPHCYAHRHAGEDNYQINNKDATKENALHALLGFLGIFPNEAVAFGDDLNDIGIIKLCGTGVAVGNALDEVKAVADYVCDTNDNDGVAKWIDKYVLKG
jgi:Cof subfamily protein (haloacid dehalogenase superfamily)